MNGKIYRANLSFFPFLQSCICVYWVHVIVNLFSDTLFCLKYQFARCEIKFSADSFSFPLSENRSKGSYRRMPTRFHRLTCALEVKTKHSCSLWLG